MPTQKQFLDNVGLTLLLDELGQHLKSKLDKLTVGDGIAIDNNNTIRTTGIPYGECDSTSTATAFTATVPGIYKLEDGVCCIVKNGVVTSASGFTLNINGLGAKPSYSNMALGNPVTPTNPTRDTTIFNINYAMLFVYSEDVVEGGCWICYRGYDANTNTIGYQVRSNSHSLPASQKFYRYRLLFTSADGTHYVPANTSTSTNATASRTVNLTPIDPFGHIVYYGTTAAVEANARPGAGYLWIIYTLTLGYSFNRTGAALTLDDWAPVYIKCAPQADGSAIIDADNPYVQALPTTADGKIYIFLGVAYNATSIELLNNHPVYYHDGTGIRLWTGKDGYTKDEVDTALNEKKDKDYVVNITFNNGEYSSDKTYSEIVSAATNGKTVVAVYNGYRCPLYSNVSGGEYAMFTFVDSEQKTLGGVTIYDDDSLDIWDTDAIQPHLTFDSTPTANSKNPVRSGGVKTALDAKQDKDLVVNVTESNNTLSADKTFAEISTAYTSGKNIRVKYEGYDYIVQYVEGNTDFYFTCTEGDGYCVRILTVDNHNSWEYNRYGYQSELTFDNTPTANSNNPVKSSGIKIALDGKLDDILVVTLTKSMGNITSDKTISQINTAISNGTEVIVKYQGRIYHHTKSDTGTSPATPEFSCLDAFTNKMYGVYATSLGWFENTIEEQSKLVSGTNIKTINNLSIIGSGDIDLSEFSEDLLIKITYNELKTLRDNSELSPGTLYRITDYQCTTTQENTQSAGHQFDIVLLALSENKLAEEGWAMEHPTDVYDVTFSDGVTKKCYFYEYIDGVNGELCNLIDVESLLGASELGYDEFTINRENKTILVPQDGVESTALIEENLQYSYFQNSNLNAWKVWYCLDNDTSRFAWASDILSSETNNPMIIIQNGEDYYVYVRQSQLDNENGYAWAYSGDANNFDGYESLDLEDIVYTQLTNPNIGDIALSNNAEIGNVIVHNISVGRGVIYRLIDEFNNDCPYDFKNILFANEVYFPSGMLGKLSFERFDPSTNNEEILTMYFYTFSLLNWETTTEYDELSGEDITTSTFKNITDFSFGPVTGTNLMTGMSFTLLGAYNNKIERPKITLYQDEGYDDGHMETTELLPNNIILANGIGEVSNCVFKDRAHNCLISPDGKLLNFVYDIEIGETCYNILIDASGSDIKIASACHDISIGSFEVRRVHIGNSSNNLDIIGDGIINLIIGQQSKYIKTLGDHINYVTIGNACSDIFIWDVESLLIGNKCSRIEMLNARTVTIGDSCGDIYFGRPLLDNGTLITKVIPSTANLDLPSYMPNVFYGSYSPKEYRNIIIEYNNGKIFVSYGDSYYVWNLHILPCVGLHNTSSITLSLYLQTENIITTIPTSIETVTLIPKNSQTISV